MNTEAFELFFSLLAIVVLLATVAVVVVRFVGPKHGSAAEALDGLAAHRMAICAAITGTAMLGSLYFSEIANYVPCTLCWYQRIAMYPLAIFTTIAALRKDDIRLYVTVLASIGAVISMYHWLLERFPSIDAGVCSTAVPCDLVWFEKFGFVTLPFMALTAFLAVVTVTTLPRRTHT